MPDTCHPRRLALPFLLLLPACASTPDSPLVSHDGNVPIQHNGAPAAPCSPAQLLNPQPGEMLFESTDASTPRRMRLTTSPLPGNQPGWLVLRVVEQKASDSQHDSKEISRRTQTLIQLTDGSIALSRETNSDDAVIVVFDPPMIVYPATLAPGDGFTQSFHVTVHPMSDEKKIKVQGPGTQHISQLPQAQIVRAGNLLTATLIRSLFTADFGGPKTRNETLHWFIPGTGLVLESHTETTKLLGIQIRENSESWIRAEYRLK